MSKNVVPSMHRHASGQAFARVFEDGRARNIYFGAYGSKEARTAYGQFLATYVAGEPFEPQRKRKLAARGPTVDELLVVYLAEEIAHRSANVQLKTKLSLRPLQKLYGTTDANAFGPARRCWWVGGLVLGQARSCKCEPATSPLDEPLAFHAGRAQDAALRPRACDLHRAAGAGGACPDAAALRHDALKLAHAIGCELRRVRLSGARRASSSGTEPHLMARP